MITTMQYTWMQKIINFVYRPTKPQINTVIKSWSLYQDLQLPLEAYIKATCNGDLSGLIISGEPTEYALLTAWESILEQATKYLGGKKLDANLKTANEYEFLSNRERLGRMYLELAKVNLTPALLEGMRQFNFPLPSELTEENKSKCISIFLGWLNKEGILLDKLEVDLEKNGEAKKEHKIPTRSDYVRFLLYCSRAFQCPVIHVKDLTTEQYFEYVNMYNAYAEEIEKQKSEINKKTSK